MAKKLLICHASAPKSMARRLVSALASQEFEIWQDVELLLRWPERLSVAVSEADIIISFAGHGEDERFPLLTISKAGAGRLPDLPDLGAAFALNLHNTKTNDADLKRIGRLTSLRQLWLYSENVADVGVAQLAPLANLETFGLGSTRVTDDCISVVKRFTQLRGLSLFHTRITDSRIEELGVLRLLSSLSLPYDSLTDKGIAILCEKRLLHTLDNVSSFLWSRPRSALEIVDLKLRSSKITDEGVARLPSLPSLSLLDLGKTQITDASLRVVKKFQNLSRLFISRTRITDEGLREIRNLEKLERLSIDCNHVSDYGLAELAKFPRLNCLSVIDTNISLAGLEVFCRSKPWGHVSVSKSCFSVDDVNCLRTNMPGWSFSLEAAALH